MKKYLLKIYDSTGATFKETINPATIKNDIIFSSSINGGQGQLNISLNVEFDNYSANIADMNIVKVYQVDDTNNLTGRLIYTGFISTIKPFWSGSDEGVNITLLGLSSLLSFAFYKDADYTVPHVGVDPEALLEAIIDHFNTVYSGSLISYTAGSIDNVGTNVSYTFRKNLWLQSVIIASQLAGANYYWYVDETGLFTFTTKPASSTHTFTIGKDVDSFTSNINNERVRNKVTVEYTGAATVTSDDATSQTAYGVRERYITDSNIGNAASATQRADQEIDENKDAKFNVVIRINSEYDIETIKPGDTCKVRNYNSTSTVFQDNMQIVKVYYSPDFVTLELEEFTRDFGKVLQDFVNK